MTTAGAQDEVLDRLPALQGLLAQAVLTSVRRPGAKAGLPTRGVSVHDVVQDEARLAAYARVCGFTLRNRVPPTWLHVLTFPLQVHVMAARGFPFPMAGMVHVANTMTLHRPVEVGEVLTLSSRAQALRPHRKGWTVDLAGEAQVGEEQVWRGASTYLVRGSSTGAGVDGDDPHEEPATVDALAIAPTAQWRLPGRLGRDYARVSRDVNPVHLNPLAARALGFPRTIAHGMWTHARALAALDARLPAAYRVDVRFAKPVLLPSTVRFGAEPVTGGWRFAVTGKDGVRDHLAGSVSS